MEEKNYPFGVLFFGGLNCFVFGLFSLIIFLTTFFKITPSHINQVIEIFKNHGIAVQITYKEFRIINIVYIIVASIFFISGLGLLLKKEWARKLTVYFSFFWLLFIVLNALAQPFIVRYSFFYALYFAILVLYFTGKNIQKYFRD